MLSNLGHICTASREQLSQMSSWGVSARYLERLDVIFILLESHDLFQLIISSRHIYQEALMPIHLAFLIPWPLAGVQCRARTRRHTAYEGVILSACPRMHS